MVHGGAFGSGSLQWDPLYHEDARDNTNSGGLHLVTFIIYVPLLKLSPPSHTVPPSWGSSIQTHESMEIIRI